MRHRGLIRALAAGGTILAACGCATSALLEQELTKTNTQTVLAFEATVFNKHDVPSAFDHYVGESFVEHDAPLAGSRQQAQRAYRALIAHEGSDAHRSFERSIAQGQLVATHATWNLGAPGGAALAVIDIYRLRDGRIVEHWSVAQPVTPQQKGTGEGAVPGEPLPP
jgi:predicted SnoaL-like aldol condensation-catalyzing enzyme